MSNYSRGRLILSLLQNNNNLNNNDKEEDPVSSVSKESSPAPSLTELRVSIHLSCFTRFMQFINQC